MLLYDDDRWKKFWVWFYKLGLDKKYGEELERDLEKILFEIFYKKVVKNIDRD